MIRILHRSLIAHFFTSQWSGAFRRAGETEIIDRMKLHRLGELSEVRRRGTRVATLWRAGRVARAFRHGFFRNGQTSREAGTQRHGPDSMGRSDRQAAEEEREGPYCSCWCGAAMDTQTLSVRATRP